MRVIRQTSGARHVRPGFTLVELAAGLALVGLVFIGVWALLDSIRDGRDRIVREAEEADADANRERLLTLLFANAEVRTDSVNRFVGDEMHASFETRCVVPQGWMESCRVELRLSDAPTGRNLAWVRDSISQVLRHFDGQVELRYLGVVGGEEHWVSQWGRSIAVPEAIALVAAGDTTVVGGRGRQ